MGWNREWLSLVETRDFLKSWFPDPVPLGLLPCFGILCSLVLAAEPGIKTQLLEPKYQGLTTVWARSSLLKLSAVPDVCLTWKHGASDKICFMGNYRKFLLFVKCLEKCLAWDEYSIQALLNLPRQYFGQQQPSSSQPLSAPWQYCRYREGLLTSSLLCRFDTDKPAQVPQGAAQTKRHFAFCDLVTDLFTLQSNQGLQEHNTFWLTNLHCWCQSKDCIGQSYKCKEDFIQDCWGGSGERPALSLNSSPLKQRVEGFLSIGGERMIMGHLCLLIGLTRGKVNFLYLYNRR